MKKKSSNPYTFMIAAIPIAVLLALNGYNNSKVDPVEEAIAERDAKLTAAAEQPDPTDTPVPVETPFDLGDSVPEPNTNEMVNYLSKKAKNSVLEGVTDKKRDEAVEFIVNTYPDFFTDNETMENTMYYGYYLDYAYEPSGPNNVYANLGIDTYQVVKYVYRGVETVSDQATQSNLYQIQKGLSKLGYDVQ